MSINSKELLPDKTFETGYGRDIEETSEPSLKILEKRIWRVKDVAEFLNCSIGHVYNLTSDERIPRVKKGKFLYFIPDEIFNWILEGDLQ